MERVPPPSTFLQIGGKWRLALEQIPWLIIGFVWILNFAISWWNARVVGLVWVETKHMGGWPRFMTWMGWLMSASGFTWCYLVVLLFGAYFVQPAFLKPHEPMLLTPEHIRGGFALGYLIILPGILFSGLMIWIDSVSQAWRRRDPASIGVASWNTFAQAHNTYSAMRGAPEAWNAVGDLFSGGSSSSGGDGKGKALLLIIVLVVMAVVAGILTTSGIVGHYAGSRPLPDPFDRERRRFGRQPA